MNAGVVGASVTVVSGVMQPVGPLPPSVYWRRRILLLLVLVLILLLVRWLVASAGGGSSAPSPTPTPVVSTSSPPASSAAPSPTPTASRTPSPTPTPTPVAVKACPASVIQVSASTDSATYSVGSTPRLRLKVTNTGKVTCTRDVGSAQDELFITRGGTQVWSSDDCNPAGTPDIVTLKADGSWSVDVTWPGRYSKPNCPPNQPVAPAGSYSVTGRNGSVKSKPVGFSLT